MITLTGEFKVKDLNLASQGVDAIYLAESRMPTLMRVRRRFTEEQPLRNITIGACLHITRETAVLAETLRAGGARVVLCGSNPLSTQDDVAAALASQGFSVYAWRGNDEAYYDCLRSVLDQSPTLLIDDGADLIVTTHKERRGLMSQIVGAQEETTTGVKRLQAMEAHGVLQMPVVAVNDARVKTMFDNRYGTGQGVVSVIKALNVLFAGKNVVIAGYGYCSWGMATRARGLGANVIVTEVSPLKALEAVMDGFTVLPMDETVSTADMIFTSTGCRDVLVQRHFESMKDGVILANLGHFNVEISVKELEKLAVAKKRMNQYVDEYRLAQGTRIYLLAEGRLANLAVLGGHPAEIMDLSFSVQALASEYLSQATSLEHKVYPVPQTIDEDVARMKLATMDVRFDKLTETQRKYITSFDIGT